MIIRALAALLLVVLIQAPAQAQTVILYAHADRTAADQLAGIARIWGPVWTDASIQPGAPWRTEVARRIRGARVVLVVWSAAAASSVEVGAEWRQALAAGRRVVPVVTDAAPLPAELGQRQWVQSQGCSAAR